MRTFLCTFRDFSLAIPIHHISSITLHECEAARDVEYDHENRNTYISLPHILKLPPEDLKHGLVLKSLNCEDGDLQNEIAIENKTILLTNEVKCEAEIPSEEIYLVPKVFNCVCMRFSALFSGIQFNSREASQTSEGPILILNIEQLIQSVQKEPVT
jgi:hypothetical protein